MTQKMIRLWLTCPACNRKAEYDVKAHFLNGSRQGVECIYKEECSHEWEITNAKKKEENPVQEIEI